jgi:hypothetical protein
MIEKTYDLGCFYSPNEGNPEPSCISLIQRHRMPALREIEISFDVQFTVRLQKGKTIRWPRACHRPDARSPPPPSKLT